MEDRLIWRWANNASFTVHSFYRWLEYGGIPNTEYQSIWKSHIPLKIKIFLWLVRKNKILTKANLKIKGWQDDSFCVFCSQLETTDHLFVSCSYSKSIWDWITSFNNFNFDYSSLEELWFIDAVIPLKDRLLVELLRGAVLWCIWLEKNRVCFNDKQPLIIKALGGKIISLAYFWCNAHPSNSILKLSLMLSSDVKDLPDQLQEEEHSSPDMAQAVALLLSIAQENSSMDSGTGNPMSGGDPTEEEPVDWEALS